MRLHTRTCTNCAQLEVGRHLEELNLAITAHLSKLNTIMSDERFAKVDLGIEQFQANLPDVGESKSGQPNHPSSLVRPEGALETKQCGLARHAHALACNEICGSD